MRQIILTELTPGMVLGRSIINSKGQVLLVSGTILTDEYIRKLHLLKIETLFISDGKYDDIIIPEYLSLETQQRALSILSTTMDRIEREGTFEVNEIFSIASDIVEELITISNVTIHLTGIATHDNYTLAHSLNCSIYAALLARFCGFSISQLKVITCGALLHDMGKTEIDKEILNKKDFLTEDEFSIIKDHPIRGFNLLTKKRLEISSLVAHMAWQHHEKVDGSGYPRGLQGEEILSYARLLAIVDVYEAITGHRPYRQAMSPEDAYNTIREGLGTSFDREFGEIFLSKIAFYGPGSEVLLNTGWRAVIVSIPPDSPQRPIIRLIAYPDGRPYTPPLTINLLDHPAILIKKPNQ